MPWLMFWLIAQIITESRGCLKCSQDAMAVVKEFKHNYLEKKLRRNPELKATLKAHLDHFLEELPHQRIDEKIYMGVIDEFSLVDLAANFKRCMKQIMENEFKDVQLHKKMTSCFQKLMTTFHELLPQVAKLYCSNECGMMSYVLTNCFSCITQTYTCTRKFRCGERRVKVEMDEDLILDCALEWHKFNHGAKRYSFFRIVNGKLKPMTSGMDPFLVKKEANVNDAGRYRCDMIDPHGSVSSQLDFQVQVVPSVGKTTWFPRPRNTTMGTPRPPLVLGISSRAPPPQADWTVWIVIGSTAGLFVFIFLAFLFAYFCRKKNKEEEDDDDDESESESSELVSM
ncbi:izumo sperm-egg fusion protein 1 [Rhineura floridana]|uniref:izumo sperm-egg fusion protein 1 n=1 Tax=Rhineura floridana TaxID=261503 RepID=UPI002AC844D0|nr:izumo sperm-egg fusion protein 1 [Rhineura floridana]